MRHPSTAAPVLAAMFLAPCSAESGPPENGIDTAVAGEPSLAPLAEEPTEAAPPSAEDDDTTPGPSGGAAALIPARFHGEWNTDLSACGTGLGETRLRIDAARLSFYESTGMVRRVEIESERVADVTAEYRGEGDTWTNERRLGLSADGDRLTVSGERSILTRSRCP